MPPEYAPISSLRIISILIITIAVFVKSSASHANQLYVVCKSLDSPICLMWPIEMESQIEIAKEFYEVDSIKCGLSDLLPIPPHRKYVMINMFKDNLKSKYFCKLKNIKEAEKPIINVVDTHSNRIRRQTTYHPRGRYRGQTQSQYLSIDRGNGKDEGKAEAHSAADSSRAIVSGNSGMGQAQSQTVYDPSCDECLNRHETERPENLFYNSRHNGHRNRGGNFDPTLKQNPDGSYNTNLNPQQNNYPRTAGTENIYVRPRQKIPVDSTNLPSGSFVNIPGGSFSNSPDRIHQNSPGSSRTTLPAGTYSNTPRVPVGQSSTSPDRSLTNIPGGSLTISPFEGLPNIPGGGSANAPGGGLGNLPGGGLGNLPGGGVGNLPGRGLGNLPGGGVGNLPGRGLGNLPGGGVGNLPGRGLGNLPGGDLENLPGGVLGNLPGGGLGNLPVGSSANLPGVSLSNYPGSLLRPLPDGSIPNPAGPGQPGEAFRNIPGGPYLNSPKGFQTNSPGGSLNTPTGPFAHTSGGSQGNQPIGTSLPGGFLANTPARPHENSQGGLSTNEPTRTYSNLQGSFTGSYQPVLTGNGQNNPAGNYYHQPGNIIASNMANTGERPLDSRQLYAQTYENQKPGISSSEINHGNLPGSVTQSYSTNQGNIYHQKRPESEFLSRQPNYFNSAQNNARSPTTQNGAPGGGLNNFVSGNISNQPGLQGTVYAPGSPIGSYPNNNINGIFTGPGSRNSGGSVYPENNGINWPFLTSLLPGSGSGSTYLCCVVSPANAQQSQSGNGVINPYNSNRIEEKHLPNQQLAGSYTGPENSGSVNNYPGNNLLTPNSPYNVPNSRAPYGVVNEGQPNTQYVSNGQNSLLQPPPYGIGNVPQGGRTGSGQTDIPNNPNTVGNLPNTYQPYGSGQNLPSNSYGSSTLPKNNVPSANTQYDAGLEGQNRMPSNLFGTGYTGSNPSYPFSTQLGTGNMGQSGQYDSQGPTKLNHPYGPVSLGKDIPTTSYGSNNGIYEPNGQEISGQNINNPMNGVYQPGSPGPSSFYSPGSPGLNIYQAPNAAFDQKNSGANPIGPLGPGHSVSMPPVSSDLNGQYGQNNPIQSGVQNPIDVSGNGKRGVLDGSGSSKTPLGEQYGLGLGQRIPYGNTETDQNSGTPYGLGRNDPNNGRTYIQGPNGYGNTGQNDPSGEYGPGVTGQTNVIYPNRIYGPGTNQQPGVLNQVSGGGNGIPGAVSIQNNDQNYGSGGVPQNVIDSNSITSTLDDYDSEAQASVAQAENGTTALASSKGGNKSGRAQTQVEGTYAGTGSFSANAEISDDNKAAQSHVSGSKKGASSSSEGRGRKNKSQASVKLGSETGSIITDSQSSGDLHSSNSQVQGSVKGGMADAQAKGSGSTSSQAQIGFTPYKEEDKKIHDVLKNPFEGTGTASAQTSGRIGTSQSQLRGTFKYGITYNGAAQAGSSLDKDAVFTNLHPFDKIDVFDDKNKNVNVDEISTQTPTEEVTENDYASNTPKEDVLLTNFSDHNHSDHHKDEVINLLNNTTTRPPPEGNRRSFENSYSGNGADYEYTTDKDDAQPDDYDIDDAFGTNGPEQNEYPNYDDINKDTETHQSLQSPRKKGLEVKQSTGGNTQHIILGSLDNHDAKIIQKNSDHPDVSKVYQPGERIPGMGGYTIPVGFTGSVKSVASKEKTYVVGSRESPSQAQTVTLTPGNGKVKYVYPDRYGKNVNPKDLKSLYNSKAEGNRYVSVSKSVTRDLDNENNVRRQYSHTYYTKSSSCGYFTFTCTMVSSAEGKKKICKPKIPTNPDGSPMKC